MLFPVSSCVISGIFESRWMIFRLVSRGNQQVEPDAIMPGFLLEVETCGGNRSFLKDLVDRGQRWIRDPLRRGSSYTISALNLVFDERQKIERHETHCRRKNRDQIHSGTNRHSHAGDDPDRRRRREPKTKP